LVKRKKLAMDYVRLERSEIEESGDYDLEGLFVRLHHAIDSIKAKRVVLDTIDYRPKERRRRASAGRRLALS
jgi:circadian clock protein KaiC